MPRLIARGHIIDSSLYFRATELLGPSLESAGTAAEDLEPAALRALERVHACGVLHGDIRLDNILRNGRKGVVLADFAFSKLAAGPQLIQEESSDAPLWLAHSRKELQRQLQRQRPTKSMAKMSPNTQIASMRANPQSRSVKMLGSSSSMSAMQRLL
ncbi:hypothetical protein WJX74_001896 [Apatococcus lobatus]|uniref:Protein kinase domain-containing protein n=1 Tax=Apatococcus lobatus TaxID=904363 RepID=A0AAW1Q792_9CHLO